MTPATCRTCRLMTQLQRASEHGDHAAELILRARTRDCAITPRECDTVPTVTLDPKA